MGHILDNDIPIGGLNLDDNDLKINYSAGGERLPYSDYRNARNIRTAINFANRGKALTNVLSNLEITTYILPYSGGVFPAGSNRCIGAHEDSTGNTVIFFVYNSNGNHQILRYYRSLTDPLNPNGVVQQVMMYNGATYGQKGWGWTRSTRITSINLIYGQPAQGEPNSNLPGDLLYWCDPVPHVIDITRANICNKQKTYVIYSPVSFNSFASASNFQFELQSIGHTVLTNFSIHVLASVLQTDGTYLFNGQTYNTVVDSNAAVMAFIAPQISNASGGTVTAEACGCAMTITETNAVAQQAFYYSITGPALRIYADNWYGVFLTDRYWDRCMWQPMDVPQGTYKADSHYLPNNVSNGVFQFRLLYTYRCGSP